MNITSSFPSAETSLMAYHHFTSTDAQPSARLLKNHENSSQNVEDFVGTAKREATGDGEEEPEEDGGNGAAVADETTL